MISKTEELNLLTNSTLQNMRDTVGRQNSDVYLKMKGQDQKFEMGKSEIDEVFGSTQIDNFDNFIDKGMESMDFTKKIVSRNNLKRRFLSPQPCLRNVLKQSIDFQSPGSNPYREKSPTENQMIFQKMVREPKMENLANNKSSSRYEAFRDSVATEIKTPEGECGPFTEAPKSDR